MVLVKGDLYLNGVCSDDVHANKRLCWEPQSFETLALADESLSGAQKLLISVHSATC